MWEYSLDLLPLEDDLLSLEWDSTFKELYLDQDTTSIYYAAKALMRLQRIYGWFPRILGKGDYSKALCDMMLRMRLEMAVDDLDASQTTQMSQHIDSLIIIDRSVDLVTPLCTQLTYEGLIDEIFHIKNCTLLFLSLEFSDRAFRLSFSYRSSFHTNSIILLFHDHSALYYYNISIC